MARADRWVGFPEVEHWLGRLHPNSRGGALTRFSCFMDWLVTQLGWEGKTPSDLVRLQREALFNPVRQFEVLNLLQKYVSSACDRMSVETKKQTYTVVRGFFEHNRAPLPLDKSFKIRGSRAPRQVTLDIDGLKQLIFSLREDFRSVGFLLVYSLLDLERFNWVNWHGWHERMGSKGRTPSLREQIENNWTRLKMEFEGRKGNNRPYYTFLGGYGLKIFKSHLAKRGEVKKGEPIFRNSKGLPLKKRNIRAAFLLTAHRLGLARPVVPPCPHCNSIEGKRTHTTRRRTDGSLEYLKGFMCMRCGSRYEAKVERGEYAGVRYGTNPHEVRDIIRSFLHTCKVDKESVEFWMGHQVDELNYNKFFELDPSWCEEQYAEAESYLDQVFLTSKARIEVRHLSKVVQERDAYARKLEQQLQIQNARIDEIMKDLRDLKSQIAQGARRTQTEALG